MSGEKLYSEHCSSCHSDASMFENYSLLLLKEAIYENVSEMSHLENLSEPELILISEFISGGPIDTNIPGNIDEDGNEEDNDRDIIAGKALVDANCLRCHPGSRYPGKNEAQIGDAMTTRLPILDLIFRRRVQSKDHIRKACRLYFAIILAVDQSILQC